MGTKRRLKLSNKPNCFDCVHRRTIPGNANTRCNNSDAKVEGNLIGIKRGWFLWPLNFDPTWLVSCNGFSNKKEDNKPDRKYDPLL